MPSALRLPLRFDAAGLCADARALEPQQWQPHFNTGTYRGDWSGVALRASRDDVALYPDPNAARPFSDTPAMTRCPNVRAALQTLRCEYTSVRFLRLGPGAQILPHRDYALTLDGGEARLHVCVVTNDGVSFTLDGNSVVMREGECWYLDVNRPHEGANAGASPRIHLVVDCLVNDWLSGMLAAGAKHG